MKNKIVVVTDLGTLKAYKVDKHDFGRSPRLELLQDLQIADAHEKLTDKVTDLAGRFGKGGGPGTGAGAGERHNIELEHRKRLVRRLTDQLNTLIRHEDVETCYFAASKEINHQILDGLDPHVRMKIEKNIPLDLTKLNKVDLLGRFVTAS
jgi:hypothetical protein